MQVLEVLRLHDGLALHLLRTIGHLIVTSPIISRRLFCCSSHINTTCFHRHVRPEQLPYFLTVLPTALHPLALRAHSPAIVHNLHLNLPQLQETDFVDAITAACGLPHLTSLSLSINHGACRLHGTSADSTHLPVALYHLARSTSLRSLYLDYDSTVPFTQLMLSRPGHNSVRQQLPFCDAVLAALPQFHHITDLTLAGFRHSGSAAAMPLLPLPVRLRRFKFVPSSLDLDAGKSPLSPRQMRPAYAPAQVPMPTWFSMLGMLRELEELDISGTCLSTQCWREIVPELARLPLRSLNIARCGLVLTEALPVLSFVILDASAARQPFARLKSLDISGNPLHRASMAAFNLTAMNRSAPRFQPISAVLGQLTALSALSLIYRDSTVMDWFLQQLPDSAAMLERFAVGMGEGGLDVIALFGSGLSRAVQTAAMRSCITTWPDLRVLHVSWPDYGDVDPMLVLVKLPKLEELRVAFLKVDGLSKEWRPAEAPRGLTSLIIGSLALTAPGAWAFSSWLHTATTLRVLSLHAVMFGVQSGEDPGHALAGVVACVRALTRLVELRVRVDRACVGSILGLADALPELGGLTCLEFGLPKVTDARSKPPRREVDALVTALRSVPRLAELQLHHVRLDGDWKDAVGPDAVGVATALEETFSQLPRLVDVTLNGCVGEARLVRCQKLEECLPWGGRLHATPVPEPRLSTTRSIDCATVGGSPVGIDIGSLNFEDSLFDDPL